MALGLDLGKDVGDAAVGADNERGTLDAHHFVAVHVLFFDHAEGLTDLLVGVGEQGVGQVVLSLELFLLVGRISGDAQNDRPGFLQFFVRVAEPARFNGSTRGIGFRIEEEDYGLPAKILERELLSVFVGESEIRSFVVDVHRHLSAPQTFIPYCRRARHLVHDGGADQPGNRAVSQTTASCQPTARAGAD